MDSALPRLIRTIGATVSIVGLSSAAILWSLSLTRRSAAFAFAINWALMLGAFIIWTFVPIRFGSSYYRVQPFECSGRIYELLGVRLFQRVLRRSTQSGQTLFPRYVPGPRGGAAVIEATQGPETAHALIFLVVAVLSLDAALQRWWDTAVWLLLFNILLNAYPVISLRYLRVRAVRLFGRDGERRNRSSPIARL